MLKDHAHFEREQKKQKKRKRLRDEVKEGDDEPPPRSRRRLTSIPTMQIGRSTTDPDDTERAAPSSSVYGASLEDDDTDVEDTDGSEYAPGDPVWQR